jgi:ATP-dependent helicase HrpA
MPVDRQAIGRRLRQAEKIAEREQRRAALARIASRVEAAERRLWRRQAALPATLAYPEDLPITGRRPELADAIRDHQVVIVAGETGSGKSTQIPKLCLELGRGVRGMIGHTQPRRIAARSIAERVAEELGGEIGGIVGFAVRFTDRVGDSTLVKVMTDGILLAEIQRDRLLLAYDTIIVDEAHERSLNIDFLLGYLKNLLPRRPDLKLIITSATIDTERFAAHFDGAPVVEVSGRTYPVEIRYRPLEDPTTGEPRDQPQGICDAVAELAASGTGDILVFCSGEREIRDATDALAELRLAHTELLPLYGRLSAAEQHRVFEPHPGRRIVLATNVAETSLTVPGIRSVVDAGTARISRYSRRTKVQRLPIEPVSQASAAQRAGRCGRVGPGVCIRLYSEDDLRSRPEFTEPEILRTNLASVILQMASLDLGDVASFPFLDPPDHKAIRDGVALLEELGAIGSGRPGTWRWLTDVGRQMARLPIDPRLARMVIAANENACLREVLIIASALSLQDPRERPAGREAEADAMHRRFVDERSDFLGWLNLWEYLHTERRARTSSQFRRLCRDEFLHYRRIREWQDLHTQLRQVIHELGFHRNRRPAEPEMVHRALLSGLLSNIGTKDPDGFEYRGARGIRFSISPGSALFKRSPRWVMAGELVETTRLWAHAAAEIEPEWVEAIGAHLVRRNHSDPWWDPDRGSSSARESVTIFGLVLATRTVAYGRIDPAGARDLFIRHALVGGEWDASHTFVARNRERIAEVTAIETRERRNDLMVDDETLVAWFDARVPLEITDVRSFDRWWRDARKEQPRLLELSISDVIDPQAPPPDESGFPAEWEIGDISLPLRYEFDSDTSEDGVVVEVPVRLLDRVDPAMFEWHIPGLRRELVTALVRSLPKAVRKALMPIADTVEELLAELDPAEGGLIEPLRQAVMRKTGLAVAPDAFDLDSLPHHLRPRFRVVDDDAGEIAAGESLAALKEDLLREARATVGQATHELERSGITAWDFGELPRRVELTGPTRSVTAFPALVDEGETVGIRLLATEEDQAASMWEATRRLLTLNLPGAARLGKTAADAEARRLLKLTGPYADTAEWIDDCLTCAIDEVLAAAGGPVWDGIGFDRLLRRVRDELADRLAEIAAGSIRVLSGLRQVELRVAALGAPVFADAVADVAEQVHRLIYPGFVAAVGGRRLGDVERYLDAIVIRLDGLADHPERDRRAMAEIRTLEAEHDRLVDTMGATVALIDAGWLLQELRVSLFAQQLGTKTPVSPQRVRRALDAAIGVP